MVTKVLVKKNSHIEFQLGGGGYGTFGDNTSDECEHASSQGETKAEKALRDSIKKAPGPTKRKQFEKELASLREERERENARAEAEAKQAQSVIEANLRAKRAESGSRFNVRYRNGIPDGRPNAGRPHASARAVRGLRPRRVRLRQAARRPAPGQALGSGGRRPTIVVRKGLLLEDVEAHSRPRGNGRRRRRKARSRSSSARIARMARRSRPAS